MGAKFIWGSLVLTPVVFVAHYLLGVSGTVVFVLAAAALIPLAWLIGEATEHVAEHTGPGIGGFVNASFGNAPELIIALFAVSNGLPDVVRGSITGSVVSNLLLVLAAAVIAGGNNAEVDRRSSLLQLGIVGAAVLLFLVPAIPALDGDPDRHSLYVVTIPVALALLALYVVVTVLNLRQHHAAHVAKASAQAWRLRTALIVLGLTTVATAFVAELLVRTLDEFGHAVGLSEFFVAVVIVAIVGNAAEHGGAIVVALRGNMKLAAEIAISSSAQVAVFVAPAVVLLSWIVGPGLPFSFRPVEIATMGLAAAAVALVVRDGRSSRWEGFALVGLYALCVGWYFVTGDR